MYQRVGQIAYGRTPEVPAGTDERPGAPARQPWRRVLAIGLIGGVLSGLLGLGGGTVIVPLLVLWARTPQREAHAISLAAIIPISCVGVLVYGVSGQVRLVDGLALAAGSIVGARIGAGALARANEHSLRIGFGLFLVAVSIIMLAG